MAEPRDVTVRIGAIIDRVTEHTLRGDAASARAELSGAREAARANHDREEELVLTSLLATHLADSGEQEQALAECLHAERLAPERASVRAATALQLFRMGRTEAAVRAGRELLDSSELHAGERHLILTMLGEAALEAEPSKAHEYLTAAFDVAVESRLEPMYWDLQLAAKLARLGDELALRYLRTLQANASASGERLLAKELEQMLTEAK